MRQYIIGPPPFGDKAEDVSLYTNMEFEKIRDTFLTVHDLDPTPEIEYPKQGMLRYFDATIYNPGAGSGVYYYTGTAWKRLFDNTYYL